MDRVFPVYTQTNNCHDCFKCLRQCPVKAIRLEEGHARVLPELCVSCGLCVEVCPAKAKCIRDDRSRVEGLLASGRTVVVSLAPSWVGEFPDLPAGSLVAALEALGFAGVGETALGAQEVSASTARLLQDAPPGLYLSTACPASVEYVEKYLPDLVGSLTPLPSPLRAHAGLLREAVGAETAVVFVGPCVAKKREADRWPREVEASLTFDDLYRWLEERGLDPWSLPPTGRFLLREAEEGALYPVEGGMTETLRAQGGLERVRFATVSGLEALRISLQGLDPGSLDVPCFLECLACPGGCVNGPGSRATTPVLWRRAQVEGHAQVPEAPIRRLPTLELHQAYVSCPEDVEEPGEEAIRLALRQVGKVSREDELNCGGCGYDTCRAFARALVLGRAEPSMCVCHMRNQAQRKANALLRCMPSGVVIVDRDLNIVECNEHFAVLFGEDALLAYRACEGLKGARLDRIVPFPDLFRATLETGEDLHLDLLRHKDQLFDLTLFPIDPGQTVGGVVMDVTHREIKREQIAQRAEEVIRRNLSTVQEIACRLGEHMAETEMLLRSIAEGYADPRTREGGADRP